MRSISVIDLRKRSGGRGYATEAAYASIKYGFERLGLKIITGRARSGILAHGKYFKNAI